jgi:NAD kinase
MGTWRFSRGAALTRGNEADKPLLHALPDFIITIGGDGTILHVSSLFDSPTPVPPVLSFSMGSLGFLLPFRALYRVTLTPERNWRRLMGWCAGGEDIDTFEEAIGSVLVGEFGLVERMRLGCELFSEDGKPIDRCPNTGALALLISRGEGLAGRRCR